MNDAKGALVVRGRGRGIFVRYQFEGRFGTLTDLSTGGKRRYRSGLKGNLAVEHDCLRNPRLPRSLRYTFQLREPSSR